MSGGDIESIDGASEGEMLVDDPATVPPDPLVPAETDYGQTDFGHPYFPDFGQIRFWPNRLWPKEFDRLRPTLIDRLWPNRLWPIFRPTLANHGLDRLWPNRLWPIF